MTIASKPESTAIYVRLDKDGTYRMSAVSGPKLVQCSAGWSTLDAAYASGARAIAEHHVGRSASRQQG